MQHLTPQSFIQDLITPDRLATIATAFPELADSASWLDTAFSGLQHEITTEVRIDVCNDADGSSSYGSAIVLYSS